MVVDDRERTRLAELNAAPDRRSAPAATGRTVRRIVAGVAITVTVLAVLGTHRELLHAGSTALARSCAAWVLAAVALECASLLAYALLQRRLLRAGGAAVRLRSVLCTVVNADAIATTVPVAGTGLAMAFAYRDFRRAGADVPTAAVTPLLSTAVSATAFVGVVATGAALSGNPVAAALGLLGVGTVAVLIGALVGALRSAAIRGRLQTGLIAILGRTGRLGRRIGDDAPRRLAGVLDGCARLRLDGRALGFAVLCGVTRWSADALCLVAVIEATGGSVPWSGLLLVWAAGAATTTLGLTPGGLGAADAVLVTALVATGMGVATAGAAVVLYRLIVLKPAPRLLWFGYRRYRLALARR
jgi:uncharacterized protein (TIRG00374 family)